jgi:ribosome-associated protein
VSAIADSVRERVQQKLGVKPVNYDGYRNSTWIVIDYGSVMVHILVPETREFYAIEQLWADGVITNRPDLD